MLYVFTLVVMVTVAISQYRNGIFTSFTMLVQVLLAGLIAFECWEPVADQLDGMLQDGRMHGYEDCLVLTAIFALAVLGMRLATNRINREPIDFHPVAQQVGGPAIGLVTGYFLSGFLVCVVQTLPLEEEFLGFAPRRPDESAVRSFLPADRVWLSMMRRAGAYPFAWGDEDFRYDSPFDRVPTFDAAGTFELRYTRYRRHKGDDRTPTPYHGEFEKELNPSK